MKNTWIMLVILIAITLAGCTGTTAADPIIGVWQDQLIGVSLMEFSGDGQYHANLMNYLYNGNWSKIDPSRYLISYVRSDDNTTRYQSIVDYDQINRSICLENTPDIVYVKISDMIVGSWTDQLNRFSMSFNTNHSWHISVNDTAFNGNWTKINDTSYAVTYSDNGTIYREMVEYNQSSNMVRLDDLPYIFYKSFVNIR